MNHLCAITERLLLTVWVGALVGVGYLAVPVLFHALQDRQLAGALAGQMFGIMGIVSLICGGLLLILAIRAARPVAWWRAWRVWILVAMLIMALIATLVLQPLMASLKSQGLVEGSEIATRFGQLHGISSLLYLATSVCGLVLASLQNGRYKGHESRTTERLS